MALCNDVHPNPGPEHKFQEIKICHANVRSLKQENKFFHIKSELAGNYDIITCSETWLGERDESRFYHLYDNQTPFRKDRCVGKMGYGGVRAWINNNIACKR